MVFDKRLYLTALGGGSPRARRVSTPGVRSSIDGLRGSGQGRFDDRQ